MNKKGFVPVITLVVIAVLVVFSAGCLPKGGGQEAGEPTPEPTQTLEVNFSQAGNILNWDSQTESYTDEWTFLYEKPGNPAISLKLVFSQSSLCNIGEGEKVCDKGELNNGDRVELEGSRVGDKVTVIKLEKLSTP